MASRKLTILCAGAMAVFGALAAPAPDAEALHVLNRLSFGPAPGDLAHVRQIGVDAYIDEQLHPERLALPATLRQQLDGLGSTRWSQRDLVAQFRGAAQAAKNDSEDGQCPSRTNATSRSSRRSPARGLRQRRRT